MVTGLVGLSTGAIAQGVKVDIGPGIGNPQVQARRDVPAMPVVLMLLRGSVSAVSQGNAANNYEAVRAMGTAAFRERNSNEALSAAFEPLRRLGFDLAPVLVTVPEITEPPTWQANGMLRVVGVFPTQPIEVPFAVVLAEEGGRWKINDLSVGARQHQQVVQAAPAVAVAKTSTVKPAAGGVVPGLVTVKNAGEKKPAANH